MKKYQQIPSVQNEQINPKNKQQLIACVNGKLSFLKEKKLKFIINPLNNALKWLKQIDETELENKCEKNEFLQLGFIINASYNTETYLILLCEKIDDIIVQKKVLLASNDSDDNDDETKIIQNK